MSTIQKEQSVHKTLDDYSRKYLELENGYDELRWRLLTTPKGFFSGLESLYNGAQLFVNQMRTPHVLSQDELQDALKKGHVDQHVRYQQLAHAASYHEESDFFGQLYLNYLKLRAFGAWEKAHARDDFNVAAAPLGRLLKTQFARAEKAGKSPYDYGLAAYSRGLKDRTVETLMNDTYRAYVQLNSERLKQGNTEQKTYAPLVINKNAQQRIVKRIWADMAVDMDRLQYSEGAHPACFGSYDHVMLSMAYDEDNALNTFMSAVHEGGHALYRQNLPCALYGRAAGKIAGRDMDEAMALFWEHGIAHNPNFAEYLSRVICDETGGEVDYPAADIHAQIIGGGGNGLRINADVLHYPLHLMQRRAVMKNLVRQGGDIRNLKQIFNAEAASYIGADADYSHDRHGILQDPHWFAGDYADFDNYFMGQNYALALYQHMQPARFEHLIKDGQFMPIVKWLNANIYQYGALFTSAEIVGNVVPPKQMGVNGYAAHMRDVYKL